MHHLDDAIQTLVRRIELANARLVDRHDLGSQVKLDDEVLLKEALYPFAVDRVSVLPYSWEDNGSSILKGHLPASECLRGGYR